MTGSPSSRIPSQPSGDIPAWGTRWNVAGGLEDPGARDSARDSGRDSAGETTTAARARPDAVAWVLLAGAILAEVSGSLSLKAALAASWLYAVAAAGYLSAFTLLALVLRRGMPLGVAYGIWGACGVALTALASAVLFGETLTWLMGAGIVLIIGGVLCLELGQHGGEAPAPGTGAPREGQVGERA